MNFLHVFLVDLIVSEQSHDDSDASHPHLTVIASDCIISNIRNLYYIIVKHNYILKFQMRGIAACIYYPLDIEKLVRSNSSKL